MSEIKTGHVHCDTSCGFHCAAQVKEDLEAHYGALLSELNDDGWQIRSWHNIGWHCELFHAESGFTLDDLSLRGGVSRVKPQDIDPATRFSVHNTGDFPRTHQVWVYGPTMWQAIGAAVREIQARQSAYRELVQALAPKSCDNARRADLYGEAGK